jgi:RNA ligase (TIGR02306 family)
MSRANLARIVNVDSISPIIGADAIELARVGGWQCVVAKNSFAPGDAGVYIEIDSFLPSSDSRWSEFVARRSRNMFSNSGVIHGHLVRTVKIRGELSQGLLLPLNKIGVSGSIGDDVTEQLGILQYEPTQGPDENHQPAGLFPVNLVPKTDAERVQNLRSGWISSLSPEDWYPTEKVDGTSLTVIRDGELLRVCSRNLEIKEGANLYWESARCLFDHMHAGMAIQAEIYGPGIQGNPLKIDKRRLAVFSVFLSDRYLSRAEWPSAILPMATPVLDFKLPSTIDGIISQANGLTSKLVNSTTLAEGIVWHHVYGERFKALGGRSVFKAINNKWLLSRGDK